MIGVALSVLGILVMVAFIGIANPAVNGMRTALEALLSEAERSNPVEFERRLQRISPYRGSSTNHLREARLATSVDLSAFSQQCRDFQKEARRHYDRMWLAILPMLAYAALMLFLTGIGVLT